MHHTHIRTQTHAPARPRSEHMWVILSVNKKPSTNLQHPLDSQQTTGGRVQSGRETPRRVAQCALQCQLCRAQRPGKGAHRTASSLCVCVATPSPSHPHVTITMCAAGSGLVEIGNSVPRKESGRRLDKSPQNLVSSAVRSSGNRPSRVGRCTSIACRFRRAVSSPHASARRAIGRISDQWAGATRVPTVRQVHCAHARLHLCQVPARYPLDRRRGLRGSSDATLTSKCPRYSTQLRPSVCPSECLSVCQPVRRKQLEAVRHATDNATGRRTRAQPSVHPNGRTPSRRDAEPTGFRPPNPKSPPANHNHAIPPFCADRRRHNDAACALGRKNEPPVRPKKNQFNLTWHWPHTWPPTPTLSTCCRRHAAAPVGRSPSSRKRPGLRRPGRIASSSSSDSSSSSTAVRPARPSPSGAAGL